MKMFNLINSRRVFFFALTVFGLILFDPLKLKALTGGEIQFFSKVNNLYYNYSRVGLHSYKCRVKLGLLDSEEQTLSAKFGSNDPRVKILENLQLYTSYDSKNGFQFSHSDIPVTNDVKFDEGLSKMLEASKQILVGFWLEWTTCNGFKPLLDLSKDKFTLEKTNVGYEIEKTDESDVISIFLNNQFLFQKAHFVMRGFEGIVFPQYSKTTDGLLVKTVRWIYPNVKSETRFTYTKIKNIEMPSKIFKQIISSAPAHNSRVQTSVEFYDYSLND